MHSLIKLNLVLAKRINFIYYQNHILKEEFKITNKNRNKTKLEMYNRFIVLQIFIYVF